MIVTSSDFEPKGVKEGPKMLKKIDYVDPRRSLDIIPCKNRKSFATVEPQRVAAVVVRSALQSAAPSAARRVVGPL